MASNNQLLDKFFTFQRLMKDQMSLQNDMMSLSMVQLYTLIYIKHHAATPMKSIAEYLKVELPSATVIVEKLVKLHFVKRQADKNDRRLVLLSLTPEGESLLTEAMKERAKNMEKILNHLSDKDKDNLSVIFDTLIVAMDKSHEK